MPSGSIEEEDGVTALRHLAADLLEMQVHRLRIGTGQDQGCTDIAMRADSAKYVGPFAALIPRRGWTAAALAQSRVNVPCWPTRASSCRQSSIGCSRACSGMAALTRSAKCFCVSPALPGPAADGAAAPTSAGTRAGTASRQHCARPVSH